MSYCWLYIWFIIARVLVKNTVNYGPGFFFNFVYYPKKTFRNIFFCNSKLIAYKVPESFIFTFWHQISSVQEVVILSFQYITLNSSVYTRFGLIFERRCFGLNRVANVITIENLVMLYTYKELIPWLRRELHIKPEDYERFDWQHGIWWILLL